MSLLVVIFIERFVDFAVCFVWNSTGLSCLVQNVSDLMMSIDMDVLHDPLSESIP